jgi:nucleoside-diphosphate-sugar epimerase
VRAALAAGVRHLVTSEFGLNTFHPNAAELPVLAAKLAAQRALEAELQDAAAAGKSVLTWTAIFTGAWYDWALARGIFWIDPTARSITRAGSGDQRVSFTRVAVNGEAVVAVLREPERFANRPAYFASHTVSMNKLIEMVGEIDDGGEKWKVVDVPDVEAIRKEGVRLWEKDRREGVDEMLHTLAFRNLAIAATFDEENRFGADFGEKVEAGWDEGSEKLKENLKRLIEEART